MPHRVCEELDLAAMMPRSVRLSREPFSKRTSARAALRRHRAHRACYVPPCSCVRQVSLSLSSAQSRRTSAVIASSRSSTSTFKASICAGRTFASRRVPLEVPCSATPSDSAPAAARDAGGPCSHKSTPTFGSPTGDLPWASAICARSKIGAGRRMCCAETHVGERMSRVREEAAAKRRVPVD
jgi:hypothetical protein